MPADNPEHGRQTQSTICKLGRVKRIKNVFHRIPIHAASRVGHLQIYVFARPHVFPGLDHLRIDSRPVYDARFDCHDTRLASERFAGIGHEVHHHLPQLRGVSFHERQHIRQTKLHPCIF